MNATRDRKIIIVRYVFGAIVDEIDDKQVSQIDIPLLRNADTQKEINDKVLEANKKEQNPMH